MTSMHAGDEALSPEAYITAVFADLLGVPEVEADDDFFALGGHSLLAMTLIARVRERSGMTLSLRDVFDAPTPAGLAARVRASP
jgi:acyl carrier protein